ncbi:MAG: hypothetical protein WC989_07500 [Micavibrio sp.]
MTQSVFEKHPKKTIIAVLSALLLLFALIAEVALRFIVSYDIGYYTAIRKQGAYHYPYGVIHINSHGFPDLEFDLQGEKRRIGYMGDSVIMGVGAGAGYRFSDLIEAQMPDYDHWTFAMSHNGFDERSVYQYIEEFGLETVVYGLNLNDILPVPKAEIKGTGDAASADRLPLQAAFRFAQRNLDGLRGKSYLYSFIRTGIKNTFERMGYGYQGHKAIELFPKENEEAIKFLAARINDVSDKLRERGVDFCLLIFPYEMQLSGEAAQSYRSLGIKWEEGFAEGSAQNLLARHLDIPYLYDGMDAFKHTAPQSPAGTYFVYNKGDKIDFNHPNREGHALLATGWIETKNCPFLK